MQKFSSYYLSQRLTYAKLFSKIDLSWVARLTLEALVKHINFNTGLAYPSQQTLAEEIGSNRQNVNKAIHELRKSGLILLSKKTGLSNSYKLSNLFLSLILPESELNLYLSEFTTQPVVNYDINLSEFTTQTCNLTCKNNKNFSKNFKGKMSDNLTGGCQITRHPKNNNPTQTEYKHINKTYGKNFLNETEKVTRVDKIKTDESKKLLAKIEHEKKNARSPLDFDYEEAFEYLSAVPEFLEKTETVRFLRQKYNICRGQTSLQFQSA